MVMQREHLSKSKGASINVPREKSPRGIWSSHQYQVARSDYQYTGVISSGQRECLPEAKGANASVY